MEVTLRYVPLRERMAFRRTKRQRDSDGLRDLPRSELEHHGATMHVGVLDFTVEVPFYAKYAVAHSAGLVGSALSFVPFVVRDETTLAEVFELWKSKSYDGFAGDREFYGSLDRLYRGVELRYWAMVYEWMLVPELIAGRDGRMLYRWATYDAFHAAVRRVEHNYVMPILDKVLKRAYRGDADAAVLAEDVVSGLLDMRCRVARMIQRELLGNGPFVVFRWGVLKDVLRDGEGMADTRLRKLKRKIWEMNEYMRGEIEDVRADDAELPVVDLMRGRLQEAHVFLMYLRHRTIAYYMWIPSCVGRAKLGCFDNAAIPEQLRGYVWEKEFVPRRSAMVRGFPFFIDRRKVKWEEVKDEGWYMCW